MIKHDGRICYNRASVHSLFLVKPSNRSYLSHLQTDRTYQTCKPLIRSLSKDGVLGSTGNPLSIVHRVEKVGVRV